VADTRQVATLTTEPDAPVAVMPPKGAVRAGALAAGTLNCLSVDVEEYFHCEAFQARVSQSDWTRLESRAVPFLEQVGLWLDEHGSRATFFVLGWMAQRARTVLATLAAAGHEIASHGFAHQHLGRLTAQKLREDLRQARGAIEGALGVAPLGYRAPTFSITSETAWALDVLCEEGFAYDSSIFPIRHDRYGVPHAPDQPFAAVTPAGSRIVEFPAFTCRVGPLRVPMAGGGYMRLMPGWAMRAALRGAQARRRPAMVYLHPWELDADQPRLPAGPVTTWRHRVGLRTTRPKLLRLLADFRFDTAAAVLSRCMENLPVFDVQEGEPR
jgi:polysaccharide deacetylase family protein (PEP-CTERM system associated)